jgi:hypothetical protein
MPKIDWKSISSSKWEGYLNHSFIGSIRRASESQFEATNLEKDSQPFSTIESAQQWLIAPRLPLSKS